MNADHFHSDTQQVVCEGVATKLLQRARSRQLIMTSWTVVFVLTYMKQRKKPRKQERTRRIEKERNNKKKERKKKERKKEKKE